ncbi:MAG TPA: hypothetical protein VK524_14645 [Polyangiaceae bacterium]|nr:hypothetical protein [Polyangiaceae bacterium]
MPIYSESYIPRISADAHGVFALHDPDQYSATLTRVPAAGGTATDVGSVRLAGPTYPHWFDELFVGGGNAHFKQLGKYDVTQLMRLPPLRSNSRIATFTARRTLSESTLLSEVQP